MHYITLIATAHSENGKCNSDELDKILEDIKPEVIFDELPIHYSEMYYSDSFEAYCINNILRNQPAPVVPLEVKSVKSYKQRYDVRIIPVDIDTTQNLSEYQNEISFLFNTIYKNEDYIRLDNEKEILVATQGFDFLNSINFLEFLEKKNIIENHIINSDIQKDRLINIYKLFQDEQKGKRENAMLQSIYKYSKENQFEQAVFLIGAEHKKSIIQKIDEFEKFSEIKLNWRMYEGK